MEVSGVGGTFKKKNFQRDGRQQAGGNEVFKPILQDSSREDREARRQAQEDRNNGNEYETNNEDMELVAVFTRRDPASVHPRTNVPVVHADKAAEWKDKVDVLILCGGSAPAMPGQTPPL